MYIAHLFSLNCLKRCIFKSDQQSRCQQCFNCTFKSRRTQTERIKRRANTNLLKMWCEMQEWIWGANLLLFCLISSYNDRYGLLRWISELVSIWEPENPVLCLKGSCHCQGYALFSVSLCFQHSCHLTQFSQCVWLLHSVHQGGISESKVNLPSHICSTLG